MHKLHVAILAALLSCSSYSFAATSESNQGVYELKGTIQSMNEELSAQRNNLSALKNEIYLNKEASDAFNKNVLNELKALRRQNQSLVDSLFGENAKPINDKNTVMDIKPLKNYDLQTPDGKMYFGENEFIYVKEVNAFFDARIDTGAAVSSISATNITEFERKGKKWCKFTIEANERSIEVEAPYSRNSNIRQSTSHDIHKRIVVELNIKVGDFSTVAEFTLADRRKLQYPLLIGRNLLQDIAVVDVARNHVQQKNPDENTLVLFSRKKFEEFKDKKINPNKVYDENLKSKAGLIATPNESNGANLGADSNKALPLVNQKIANKEKENQ